MKNKIRIIYKSPLGRVVGYSSTGNIVVLAEPGDQAKKIWLENKSVQSPDPAPWIEAIEFEQVGNEKK